MKQQDAMDRAAKMMIMPIRDLPALAVDYMVAMCNKYSGCGDVMLAALSHYVQLEEGLPCKDKCYHPCPEDVQMFEDLKKNLQS